MDAWKYKRKRGQSMSTIPELAEKVVTASNAGDIGEVKRITDEIVEKGKPKTFFDIWNYEDKKPVIPAAPGSFESVWQFTKKGAER